MKKILALVLTVVLMVGVFCIPWADSPSVSDAAWNVFFECYKLSFPKWDEPLTVSEVTAKLGEGPARQYAGAINCFYDTGNEEALEAASHILWAEPGAAYNDDFVNYVPGSKSASTTVTEQPFPDVPVDAWYAEAVAAMKDSGIILGGTDGLFHPDRAVTKGEFYALLLRAGSYDGANIGGGNSGGPHWASPIIKTAEGAILWPCPVGCEDEPTERIEAATRVAKLHYIGMRENSFAAVWKWVEGTRGVNVKQVTLEDIPDYKDIVEYVKNAPYHGCFEDDVVYAYNNGLINGVDGAGTFNPYGTLTRAEAAQMFYNAGMNQRRNILAHKALSWGPDNGVLYDFDSTENFIP